MENERKKKGKLLRFILWLVGILIAVTIVALTALNVYIGKSEPKIQGEVSVEILNQDVTVTRDEAGVPHIEAMSDEDLYRAQGYVQAQDRLFQMDLARRQASGMLAEVVGEAAVDTDKFFRTFSLRHAAELSWDGYNAEAKRVLEWYAEGVNAYIKEVNGTSKLPYEFKLLGYEPKPWTAIDSLTIGKFMAYDLGGNWNLLAFRHWALQNFTEDQMAELVVDYPENARSIIEANLANPVQVAGAFETGLIPNEFNGSNNWVVSGEKSESGAPLLADDPHLGLNTPSIWYQMHLKSPEQNVSGVIFAGIPGIILGHNESIAWGVTNVNPDVQDLYIEKPNPNNPYEFLYDGQYEKAEVRNEPILVKDGETVDFEVVVTRHGPIISELVFDEEPASAVFSMQWTALEPTRELQAVMGFNKAKNWSEFDTALRDFMAPAQNFVFAAKDGTIAYRANGNVPIRKKGNGQLPVPGDSSQYGWDGFVPFEELPTVINPKEGYIATANNEIVGDEYPYHISGFWAQPYRYERIAEMLEAKDKLTLQDMKDIQMDKKNLYAAEFLPHFIETLKKMDTKKNYSDIIASLQEWDYVETVDAPQPLVWHYLLEEIKATLFEDSMPEDVYEMMPGKFQVTDNLLRDAYSGKEGVWIKQAGGLDALVFESFERAVADISEDFGKNSEKWAWGDYHQLTFDHSIAGASKVLEMYLNPKPQPVGGSRTTVQAAANNDDGEVDHGASWRFVVDLNDLSRAEHIVGPGQSGHVKSEWYHDQIEDWINGEYHTTSIVGEYEKSYKLTLKAK
ncbi:penicillin acylase family protein [Lysinibacillus sp. 54212]|uniref:penicillin acylase family protein n=1 Tax=Lysinibacillus sp. 54212 TaxID=3119829 RepID=UPI002FC6DAA4